MFDIDIEQCACGGKLKLVAVIEDAAVIEKILMHIGLDPQPPPRAKARRVDLFGADCYAVSDGVYRAEGVVWAA